MKKLYVLRKHLGMTQKQFAEILSIGQNAYSMIETGKTSLTERNRSVLVDKLHVNPDWLVGSDKAMFLRSVSAPEESQSDDVEIDNTFKGVPYYSRPVTSAIGQIVDGDRPDYYIDFRPFNECSFYRPIFGDSMFPRYSAGDIIACKYVNDKGIILYGEVYFCVVSINNDVYETVKTLRKHPDPDYIILRPINPKYDETVIPIQSIRDLYIIKGKIEQNL